MSTPDPVALILTTALVPHRRGAPIHRDAAVAYLFFQKTPR